ncbi:MAG: beta-ketoacyl-ACP synthase III, partial [Myxococcota bacterium]
MRMNGTYITGFGKYFPGEPVSNEQMEGRLGKIGGKPSRARHRVLAQNGIKTRYYALDDAQETTVSNSEMAAGAVRDLLQNTECPVDAVGFLAAATTQGDLPVPGFASMVHGELELPAVEIATLHGVCCSGLMALKAAALQVSSGEHDAAVACASELPSRLFKAERYAGQDVLRESSLPFDTEFLRWMLSDGAGAALVQNRANPSGLSLRIDWIQIRSHADRYPLCMYAGANKDSGGAIGKGWLDYPSFEAAARDGALNLKQDIRLLDDVVKLGVNGLFELIESGKVDPDRLDWIVCHYSSEFFKSRIFELLELGGVRLPAERWFSNLTSKGNVGSASTFVLLEELFNEGALSPGQELLLMIPESGRSTMGYAKLTVVGETEKKRLPAAPVDEPVSV